MSLLDKLDKFKQKTEEITKTAEGLKGSIDKTPKGEKPKENKKDIPKKPKKPKTKCEYCNNYYTDITKHYETCTEKKLAELMKQIETLRTMVLEERKEIIVEEQPVVNAILRKLSTFNFQNYQERFKVKHNLKQFDIITKMPDGKSKPLLWNLKYTKELHPEILKDRDRYTALQIVNRWERNPAKFWEFLIDDFKQEILNIIEEYSK